MAEHRPDRLSTARSVVPGTELAGPPGDPFKSAFPHRELTSFVGREAELERVRALIDSRAPLITVFGPPGIGKTRLAQRFLSSRLTGTDSVMVGCDLRTARTTADLIDELGRQLELSFGAANSIRDRIDTVTRALQVRVHCLIALDNFDALERSAASALQQWLQHAGGAQFLVTSRRLLVVSGEQPIEIGPLPVPSGAPTWSCPSMQLFLDRARTAEPSFSATEARAKSVARLVQQLEGVPLAIELAASWMKRMDPGTASATLDAGLLHLDDFRPGGNASHRSLRRAIASSWELLSVTEQDVAAQLSLFRRGFDLEAATAVVHTESLDHGELPSIIEALREASMLRMADSALGRRWDSYEAIREFASEQLAASPPELTAATRRYVSYFVDTGTSCMNQLVTADADRANRRLAEDRSNFQAAFECASTDGDNEAVVRLALAVNASFRTHMPGQSVECLTRALKASSDGSDLDRASLLLARAEAHRNLGHLEQALEDLSQIESLLLDHAEIAARLAFEWGRLRYFEGNAEAALRHFDLALAHTHERPAFLHLRGQVHGWLGWCLTEACFDPMGFEHYEQAIRCLKQAGDPYQTEAVRVWYACHRVFFERGSKQSDFEPLLEQSRQTGDHLNQVRALIGLGCLELVQEDGPTAALETFLAALSITRKASLRREEGFATMWHALTLEELGDLGGAIETHRNAITIADEIGDDRLSTLNQIYLGGSMARTDDIETARRVLSSARDGLHPDDPLSQLAELQWSQVELAEARRAQASGSAARFRRLTRRALRKVREAQRVNARPSTDSADSLASCTEAARFLIRRCETEHRSLATARTTVRLDRDALRFRFGAWPTVSLERSPVLRRVLLALVDARAHRPGKAMTVDELVLHGWPGEHMREESKTERVRNAIKRLRRAGLGRVLQTCNGAYLLDPETPIEMEP